MAQAAAIVIDDGAATPVAHTLVPIGKDAKAVMWFEQQTPSPANVLVAKRIGYKQTRDLNSRNQLIAKSKVILTFMLPTAETVVAGASGIQAPPTKAYEGSVRIEFNLPERSTFQERKDLRVLVRNLLANAQIIDAVDNLRPIYS